MFTTARRHLCRVKPVGSTTAFTLVELLVVIGIIAVLIGILLPTLGRARSSANLIKCQANLRTLGTAMQIYVGQNKGFIPFGYVPGGTVLDTGVHKAQAEWTNMLLAIMTKKDSFQVATDQVGIGDAGTRAVFNCPDVPVINTNKGFITHYSSHPRLMPEIGGLDNYFGVAQGRSVPISSRKLASIRQPAEKAIIFDGSVESIASFAAHSVADALDRVGKNRRPYLTTELSLVTAGNVSFAQPVDMLPVSGMVKDYNQDSTGNAGNIRFRHLKDTRANALMVDGHVETFVYNPRTREPSLKRLNIFVNP